MKKFIWLSLVALILNANTALATNVNSYSFSTSGLESMADTTNYIWDLQQSIGTNMAVTSATLTITSLQDWQNIKTDVLFINLLSSSSADFSKGNNTIATSASPDNGSNFFAGQGDLLANPTSATYPNSPVNPTPLVITFNAQELADLTKDIDNSGGYFDIAFNPNCHWYDTGVTLNITTSPVPEPSTLILLGVGLAGVSFLRRRNSGA